MHTCSCMKCDISPSFQDTQSTGGIAAVEVELTARSLWLADSFSAKNLVCIAKKQKRKEN